MTTAEIQDFVPQDEWPAVSTMLAGFGPQTLPASSALAGNIISMRGETGTTMEYRFDAASELTWTTLTDTGSQQSGTATYKAIECRPGIFIIDFVRNEDLDAENVTIILDRNTGALTAAVSRFLDQDGRIRSSTDFSHSNTGVSTQHHQRSAGLAGKRIYYRYSDVESYEHIYINPGTFTWHCIRGGEAGLADTERCMTFDVAEDLYIFFWTEKVMAVEAVLLVDLQAQRSIGRMFGWNEPTGEPVILPFNSRLTVLNTTEYPQDNNKH